MSCTTCCSCGYVGYPVNRNGVLACRKCGSHNLAEDE